MGKLSIFTRSGSNLMLCFLKSLEKMTDFMLTTIYCRVAPDPLLRDRIRRRVVRFSQLFWHLVVPLIAILTVAIILTTAIVWYFVMVIMDTVQNIYLGI